MKRYQLIVVGGGTAGAICAIAAARSGLNVAVVESESYLGGMACGSGLAEMNAAGFGGKPLYGGIVGEIFSDLVSSGDGAYMWQIPMSSDKDVKIDRLRYNPESLKILLEQKAVQAGAELYYGSAFLSAAEGDPCSVTLRGPAGNFILESDYLADATGNCTVVNALGYQTIKPKTEDLAVSTLVFRLSGLDISKLQQTIHSGALSNIVVDGFSRGILKGRLLAFSPIPGTSDVSVNATRAQFDHEDVRAKTAGIITSREQIQQIIRFVRDNIPGAEHAYLSNIAALMGVRDCRKLVGEYQLTLRDLESMRDFDDTVAIGCYPVDIHDPKTNTVVWHMLPGVYRIPYRSLLPIGTRRILVAGKCICSEEKAFAAIRVMPIVMNIGQSAGVAIALASKAGKELSQVQPGELRRCLQKYEGRQSHPNAN